MKSKLLDKSEQSAKEHDKETCVHYWIIEPPHGPRSKGVCKKCGAKKVFPNYFPHSTWESGKIDEKLEKSLLEEWGI